MIDGQELRALMRLYPSGVCVVTADADGDRIGVTIGSLVSLSLDPPLVGVSVGKNVALHELLRSAGLFGVSLLRGDQAAVAAQFARGTPPLGLWSGIETRAIASGCRCCPARRRRSNGSRRAGRSDLLRRRTAR